MPINRGWAAQLDDYHSPLAQYERARTEARTARTAIDAEPIDLPQLIVATLDGAVGDGIVTTRDEAIAAVFVSLAPRLAVQLTERERAKVEMAVVLQWNQRAQAQDAEDRRGRSEWLCDFQGGAV